VFPLTPRGLRIFGGDVFHFHPLGEASFKAPPLLIFSLERQGLPRKLVFQKAPTKAGLNIQRVSPINVRAKNFYRGRVLPHNMMIGGPPNSFPTLGDPQITIVGKEGPSKKDC